MEQSKPVGSTIDESKFANGADRETLRKHQKAMYRSIVRSPVYIGTRTKTDLAVLTSMLALNTNESKMSHMAKEKRVLRYFSGTKIKRIVLRLGKKINLHHMSTRGEEIN